MPAQYVKPYVKTNKSDYIEPEGWGGRGCLEAPACLRFFSRFAKLLWLGLRCSSCPSESHA